MPGYTFPFPPVRPLFVPFFGIELQIGVGIDGDLEVCAGASGEEESVDFLKRNSRVDEDAMLFQARLLQNEH